MTHLHSKRAMRFTLAALAAVLAAGLSGCFNPFAPLVSTQRVS